MSDGLKPREQWDVEDWLDHLDGWHEGSGLGFNSERDFERVVQVEAPESRPGRRIISHTHNASALIAAGRTARDRHRGDHGV